MHPDDIAILPEMNSLFAMSMEEQGRTLKPESVTPLREGDKIELGGLCIEVIELPGHTPGSICFIERSLGLLFTGDSVGSGGEFWMQLPFALTISQLRKNLGEFMEKLPERRIFMSDYTMTRMSDILTRFDDVITSSCYILEGAERYALIDTGACNADDFRQLLRNFEDKPMVLLVTHVM